jgi:hypothetical protein
MIVQKSTSLFSISFGTPIYMFARVVVDKETGKVYLKSSEFISRSLKQLKMTLNGKIFEYFLFGVLTGFVAYKTLSGPIKRLYLSI